MRTVEQDEPRDIQGRTGGIDRPSEAVSHQAREIAAVVEVRMGQDDRIDRGRSDGEVLPVQLA